MSTGPTDIQPPPRPPPEGAPRVPGPPGTYKPKRSTGKIAAAIVIGSIGAILALMGTGFLVVHGLLRDDDGYYTVSSRLETPSYALTTDEIDLGDIGSDVPDALLGDIRIQATADGGAPLFLGIAATSRVNGYLSGVGHRVVRNISTDRDPRYENFRGGPPPTTPARAGIWNARSRGPGERTIHWDLKPGNWTIVAINPDGSRGVYIDSHLGAKIPWMLWAGLGLLLLGVLLVIGAVALAISGRARPEPESA